jgi:hypothetical protein
VQFKGQDSRTGTDGTRYDTTITVDYTLDTGVITNATWVRAITFAPGSKSSGITKVEFSYRLLGVNDAVPVTEVDAIRKPIGCR